MRQLITSAVISLFLAFSFAVVLVVVCDIKVY